MGNVPACSTPHSARGPCRGMPRIRGNHPGTSRRPPARRPLPLAYWRCLHLSSCCPPGSLACPRKQAAALPPPARPGPQAVTPGTLTWRRGLRGTTGVRSPDAGSLLAQRFACVGFGASVLDGSAPRPDVLPRFRSGARRAEDTFPLEVVPHGTSAESSCTRNRISRKQGRETLLEFVVIASQCHSAATLALC